VLNLAVHYATDFRIEDIARSLRQCAPLIGTAQSLRFIGGDDIDPIVGPLRADVPALGRLKLISRWVNGDPFLFNVQRAGDAVPGMRGKMILHAGPPMKWNSMSGPMRGAIIGAILFEGWANSLPEAQALAASEKIAFRPTHHHDAVGPMAGIISPSMYVLCVKNTTYGNVAFCNLNEGLGRVLRFGSYGEDVLDHLRWLNEWVGPILKSALQLSGPIGLKRIMVEAVKRGDECHNRHVAGNKLFIDILRPYLIKMGLSRDGVTGVLEYIEGNYYFFLNISLAACKSVADAANDIPFSTIVSTLSRNGSETGIRISGLKGLWFTSRSAIPSGRLFKGFESTDANPDMGDSTITETVGIGAFAMAAAPEIVSYLGGRSDDVIAKSQEMYNITYGEHSDFRITQFGGRGTPTGIDILKVCETGITPIINTGIAHKDGGIGQIGAGYVSAPKECFETALEAFQLKYGKI
jgi:hypothetical protein